MNTNHGGTKTQSRICDFRILGRQQGSWRPGFKSQITNHKLQIFFFWLMFAAIPAFAQAPNVRVRLYSLHSEQNIKITAKTGDLTWRSCEQCEMKHATSLTLQFS